MGGKKKKQGGGGDNKEQGESSRQQGGQQQQGAGGQQQQGAGPRQHQRGDQQQGGPQQQQQRGPQQQQSAPHQTQQGGPPPQQQRGPRQQQQQRGPQQQQRGPQQQQSDPTQQQQQRDPYQQRGPQQHQQRGPQQQYQQRGPQQQQQGGPQQQQRGPQQQQQGGPWQQQQRGPQQQQPRGPQQQQPRGPQQQQPRGPQQYSGGPPQTQQQWGPPQAQQQQWGPPQAQQQQWRSPQAQQQQWGPPQVQQQQWRSPQMQQQQQGPPQMQPQVPPQLQSPRGPPQMQATVSPQQSFSQEEQVKATLPASSVPTSPTPSQESSSSGVMPKVASGVKGGDKKGKPEQKQGKPPGKKPPPGKKEEKASERVPDEELALDIPRRKNGDKKRGRVIQLETNHFALSISEKLKVVYQYDVTMEPERPKKQLPVVMEEFRRRHFPNRYPAYDGMKNLFAASLLPLPQNDTITDIVSVFMPDNENNKEYKVTVTFNGKQVDMTPLQEYFTTSPREGHRLPPQDVLLVIDVVLRKAPSMSFISVGRSFFSPPQGPTIRLGDGMEMYNGFYQSAILGWKPFLNVDVAHKAFPQRLDGINLLIDLLRCSENDLRSPLRPYEIEAVHKFLRTLKVQYLIPGQPGSKRVMRVNGVDEPANRAIFNHNNERMTVDNYFTNIKRYRLRYPHLPCLWVGNQNRPDKILLPIELCTVLEGQPVNRKMTPDQTSEMIRYAATNTTIRKNKIMTCVNNAQYNQHPVVREFDISVSAKMEQISGHVLVPPMIGYGNNRTEQPKKGVWRPQSFYLKSEVNRWTILNLDRRTRDQALQDFSSMMVTEGQKLGMNIGRPERFIDGTNIMRNTLRTLIDLMTNLKQNQINFVVVVLSDNVPNVYSYVKQAAELQVGMLTQCVKSKNVFRPKPMTVINILLKVNSKLNGINHVLTQKPAVLRRPCMIMGADVTHPSPDAQETPSVAAVTASHDPTAFKYNICWRLQPPRVEIIEDLEDIVHEQLLYFYKNNRQIKPEHIIFFRDGVSEGFFKFVMNTEVQAIRKACSRLSPEYKPAITFLVVQKRHHTRLFPLNPRDSEDKNMNVPAGTCVDQWITHPTATDFYLVSHASIQGVAKPTKYRVLWDDKDMTENDLEELTYHLCHMFSRCTRSVSYPAPTYYAHLAAARAKVYIETRRVNVHQLEREQANTVIQDLIVKGTPMFFV